MLLGAGLLVGLAAGASVGGWWMLGGLLLAGGSTALSVWCDRGAGPGLQAAVQIACVTLVALTFAVYLVPAHPTIAALVALAVTTGAVALGWEPSTHVRRVITGSLVLAAAAFVAVCVAITPSGSSGRVEGLSGGRDLLPVPTLPGAWSVLSSGAALLALFTVTRRGAGRRSVLLSIGGGTAIAIAVAAAALYQLGPFRLGLSPTTMSDVLVAAGATGLLPALDAVIVLATIPALLVLLAGARHQVGMLEGMRVCTSSSCVPSAGRRAVHTMIAAAPAALLVMLLTPMSALMVASTVALVAMVFGWFRGGSTLQSAKQS